MKKLGLNLEQLAVESFETTVAARSRGTVRGNDLTDSTCYDENCECVITQNTCNTNCGQNTCDYSCGMICPPTEHGEHSCAVPSCLNTCTCPSYPRTDCLCV
jgi:hypothetical protein